MDLYIPRFSYSSHEFETTSFKDEQIISCHYSNVKLEEDIKVRVLEIECYSDTCDEVGEMEEITIKKDTELYALSITIHLIPGRNIISQHLDGTLDQSHDDEECYLNFEMDIKSIE